jgi:hypothetical protein
MRTLLNKSGMEDAATKVCCHHYERPLLLASLMRVVVQYS